MKSVLKNLVYFILSIFNLEGAVILMYHSVGDNSELATVKLKNFKKQLDFFKKNKFNIIKLSDLAKLIDKKEEISPRTVCLTFDDGYRDNYTNVFPLLKKYNFPAIIFMSTALIEKTLFPKKAGEFKFLSEAEIKEMSLSGLIEFGSHSHNHVKLSNIDKNEIIKELNASKEILEKIIGKKVESLSYPSGRYNEKSESIARKIFKIICTVEPGRTTAKDKSWRLKRNSIDSDVSFIQFKGIIKFGRI